MEAKKRITSISRISIIAEIFNSMSSAQKYCSVAHQVIRLHYTIPLTSVSSERSFSALRRLKTWLRADTGGNHSNNILFASVQKCHMDKIDIKAAAKEFAEGNASRTAYFEKDV